MAFTTATITHTFTNGDGSVAVGEVTCTLTELMTNGTSSVLPTEITSVLGGAGLFSQPLVSNLDLGTSPADATWRLDVRIQGAEVQTFFIQVPAGGGTVDLATLLPGAQQVT